MGTKRKASIFEDDNLTLHHNPRSSPPSLASSSPLSTSTIQSSSDNINALDFYRVIAVPYLNTRTRKRHRDDRPDAEIIHENTLRKLFDAQRFHLDEAMPVSEAIGLDRQGDVMDEEDADMTDDVPEVEIPQTIERNQKSINAFFGGRQPSVGAEHSTAHVSESQQLGFWTDART
ncbi:hypothetical protein H2200_013067 [Cladophialophora chaetospira]|uniref:Uncharacterized protein n=1 Tax=Cladophialophora chaetospira TaxID=386627 RepID=A0AA39CBS0_9EURO|nr:hypothetical protein H2200_013067 [Cladophialophora chaetospira]